MPGDETGRDTPPGFSSLGLKWREFRPTPFCAPMGGNNPFGVPESPGLHLRRLQGVWTGLLSVKVHLGSCRSEGRQVFRDCFRRL